MKTMGRRLLGSGLLSLSFALGADAPEWSPADEQRAAQVLSRLTEKTGAFVSALPVASHGASQRYGITVTNRSGEEAEVVIEFLDSAGRALRVPTAKGNASALVASIPAGGEVTEELPASGEVSQGWVRITSSQPQVQAQARWEVAGNELRMKATEPGKSSRVMLLDGADVRLAIVNPDAGGSASVRLAALDGAGNELCSENLAVEASAQVQGSVRQLLPCASPEARSVDVQTEGGKLAMEAYAVRDGLPASLVPLHEQTAGAEWSDKPYSLAAACTPTFDKGLSDIVGSAGATYRLYVRASRGCRWSIRVPAGVKVDYPSGEGGKALKVQVVNWTEPGARSLELQVGNSRHQIRQQGTACFLNLKPDTLKYPLAGDTKSVFIEGNCHWEVSGFPRTYVKVKPEEMLGMGSKWIAFYMASATRARSTRATIGSQRLYLLQGPEYK